MQTTRMPALAPGSARRRAFAGALLTAAAAFTLQACDDGPTEASRRSRINDRAGDFLASFTGPRNPDLDVLRGEVSFDGASFTFQSTSAGPIGTTPGALFVWGVNRGAGTARFPDIAPGVLFDAVVIAQADGTGRVVDLTATPPAPTVLPAGSVTINGNNITIRVPAALLPSKGFTPGREYTVNHWPRTGAGNNNQISDFAPDNSNVPVRITR
jgi:hypothetical protein